MATRDRRASESLHRCAIIACVVVASCGKSAQLELYEIKFPELIPESTTKHESWTASLPGVDPKLGLLYEVNENPEVLGTTFVSHRSAVLGEAKYAWTNIELVQFGDRVLKQWYKFADDRIAYGCHDGLCSRLVRAWAARNGTLLKGLAACSVAMINTFMGAPAQCHFVAIINGSSTILRVPRAYRFTLYGRHGDTDLFVRFAGFAASKTTKNEVGPPQMFVDILRNKPFSMRIKREGNQLLGIASYRYFEPLERWTMESIRIGANGVDSNNDPVFDVSTSLLVSPQNSPDASDWRRPSDQQYDRYLELLVQAIHRSALAICTDPQWEEGGLMHTLKCNHWK